MCHHHFLIEILLFDGLGGVDDRRGEDEHEYHRKKDVDYLSNILFHGVISPYNYFVSHWEVKKYNKIRQIGAKWLLFL